MLDLTEFTSRWRAFVPRWAAASPEDRTRLVEEAMVYGLPEGEATEVPDHDAVLAAEVAVIRACGVFDEFGYMWHNPDLRWHLCSGPEQAIHFAERGWHEMRHPSPGFDLWHYTNAHLDPEDDEVNPVVHYALEGRRHGLDTLPKVRELPAPATPADSPRRICLFAGYDVDGIVDPTVVSYLADLSRFADVYYLADCELEDGELSKLAPYTKDAWAVRHGRYDFGSYSMLATDLVGWDVIDQYDEMMLANDSCWLVQPLDTVFAKMDAVACDWWGLQATYEDFGVRDYEALGRPLSLDEVEEQMRQQDLWRYSDFIHVGSYFLVYRRRVLQDPAFRRRLETVAKQRDKTAIILKYEIGFSRYLILGGYHLATFVDGILPYHPVYRASAFDLMAEGFPLLKRQFLYENPFSAPDLRRWKQRVLEKVPDADVEAMERNLRRVAPPWSLHRSFAIRSRPDGTVEMPAAIGPDTFADEDRWVPKFDHWWLFVADPRTGLLEGAARAVFEAVRDDPSIKKIVLEGSQPLALGGANVVTAATESAPGQMYALRARNIFVTVGPRADVNHPLSARYHRFVRLGSATALPMPEVPLAGSGDVWGTRRPPDSEHEIALTGAVVLASDPAREHARAIFPSLPDDALWVTGSPRVDLLAQPEDRLPKELHADVAAVRELCRGRRLILVAPLHPSETLVVEELAAWADTHRDVAVGLILPGESQTAVPQPLIDLSPTGVHSRGSDTPPSVEMIWRLTDVLVTGSAADLADFAVLGRPAVALAGAEGTPLPARTEAPAVLEAVEAALSAGAPDPAYTAWGARLHALSDGRSAARVVQAVKATYLPIQEWLEEISPA